jgi:hypothetical protein
MDGHKDKDRWADGQTDRRTDGQTDNEAMVKCLYLLNMSKGVRFSSIFDSTWGQCCKTLYDRN